MPDHINIKSIEKLAKKVNKQKNIMKLLEAIKKDGYKKKKRS